MRSSKGENAFLILRTGAKSFASTDKTFLLL